LGFSERGEVESPEPTGNLFHKKSLSFLPGGSILKLGPQETSEEGGRQRKWRFLESWGKQSKIQRGKSENREENLQPVKEMGKLGKEAIGNLPQTLDKLTQPDNRTRNLT